MYNNNKNLNYINFIKNNQNEKNDLSISKLTYTVIQNNDLSMNKEKIDDSFHILRHKKNKFINFLDISTSNSVKNNKKSKICIHKKYISTLKTINKNNIHNSAINIYNHKINKEKNNTKNNNSLEHKHIKINSNINSNDKNDNKNDKKIIKENEQVIKEKEKCNNKKIKEKNNMNPKNNTKDIISNKSNNNKSSTNNKCKKSLDNNKCKKTLNNNKSYLNFQKKFEKKMNNKNTLLNQRRPKKLENNYNYNNKIKNEKKIYHFTKKTLNNNKLKNEKTISNLEINPKINLLPLFSEENITNNKNNNKDINNNINNKDINNNINNKDINNNINNKDINNNINNNININLNNSETNDINNQNNPNDIRLITEQLNSLYQGQNMLIKIINNLKDKVDDNYKNINERLITFEGNKTINANIKKKLNKKNYDDNKIELIKQKYNEMKFNEALLESIQNDVYLFKLLSLVKAEDLDNINVILIEDIISRLSLKLTSILKNNNRIYLGVILSFINLVVNSTIKLKIVAKLNLEDSLNYIRNDYKYFQISDVDLKLIENIIKLIKN